MASGEELTQLVELAGQLKDLAEKCLAEYGDSSESEPTDEASAEGDAAPAKSEPKGSAGTSGKNMAVILALKKRMAGK